MAKDRGVGIPWQGTGSSDEMPVPSLITQHIHLSIVTIHMHLLLPTHRDCHQEPALTCIRIVPPAPANPWLCLPFSVPLCSGDTGSAPCWMVQDSNWLQPGSHIVRMFLSPLVGRTFYREGSPGSGVRQGGGLEEE